MTLPNRLEKALYKLYNAFNNNSLHPEDACRCAVGNILNQKDFWKNLSDDHGSLQLNYVGKVHDVLNRKFEGYRPIELLQIERSFLVGCGYQVPLRSNSIKPPNPTDRDVLFNGLYMAIATLCSLEGISNIMEITQLFEAIKHSKSSEQSVCH